MGRYTRTQTSALFATLLWAGCLLLGPGPARAQQDKLALGNLYYNTDDVSDRAAREYSKVIRLYPGTEDAETAQFMLASYYHRKYYVLRDKLQKSPGTALKDAAREYRRYTDKYYKQGTHKWLSDSFFNLALVYLQLGDANAAYNELGKAKASPDKYVYIYQLVWSRRKDDVIDGYLEARELAQYLQDIQGKLYGSTDLNVLLPDLKTWCRQNRRRSI